MTRTKVTRGRKKGRLLYRLKKKKKNWKVKFKFNSVTDPSRQDTEEYVFFLGGPKKKKRVL